MPPVRPSVPRPRPSTPARVALEEIRARRDHGDARAKEPATTREALLVLPSAASPAELAW